MTKRKRVMLAGIKHDICTVIKSVDDVASYSGVPFALPVAPMVHNIGVFRDPGPELNGTLYH